MGIHRYPLPLSDEPFAKHDGGQKFNKIDLKEAYAQILLDEDSSKILVINTHKGLCRFLSLPIGVASGPEIFLPIHGESAAGCDETTVVIEEETTRNVFGI